MGLDQSPDTDGGSPLLAAAVGRYYHFFFIASLIIGFCIAYFAQYGAKFITSKVTVAKKKKK